MKAKAEKATKKAAKATKAVKAEAAKAVAEACRARGRSHVDCHDLLKHTSFGFGERYRGLYLFLIRTLPWLWGFAYYAADVPDDQIPELIDSPHDRDACRPKQEQATAGHQERAV